MPGYVASFFVGQNQQRAINVHRGHFSKVKIAVDEQQEKNERDDNPNPPGEKDCLKPNKITDKGRGIRMLSINPSRLRMRLTRILVPSPYSAT